jgi:hypothetical protein
VRTGVLKQKEKISEYNKEYFLKNAEKIKTARTKRRQEKKQQDQISW